MPSNNNETMIEINPQRPRNHAFDLLCGLCIIRMMLNHITGFTGHNNEEWWTTTYFWTFYFMSFFFFKAGYFNKTIGGNSLQYVTDKARRLLIPYVVWGCVGTLVYFGMQPFVIARFGNFIEPLSWDHIWKVSTFYGNSPVWFLFSFFTAYVAMHFIQKLSNKSIPLGGGRHLPLAWVKWLVLGFPFISYWLFTLENPLWLSLSNVFMGIFFFFLGHVWHWLLARLRLRNTLLISVVLTAIFCVLNVVWHGQYNMCSNYWTGDPLAVIINTSLALCGLSGILLSVHTPRIPVINYIGQHSMVFFVAHYPMIVLYRFIRISFGRSLIGRWDDFIILLIVVPCLCFWLVPYVERVPWLSGRFPKKEKS